MFSMLLIVILCHSVDFHDAMGLHKALATTIRPEEQQVPNLLSQREDVITHGSWQTLSKHPVVMFVPEKLNLCLFSDF